LEIAALSDASFSFDGFKIRSVVTIAQRFSNTLTAVILDNSFATDLGAIILWVRERHPLARKKPRPRPGLRMR